jgi:hypothetical protein
VFRDGHGVKQDPDPGTVVAQVLSMGQVTKKPLGPLLKCRTVFHFSAVVKISILFLSRSFLISPARLRPHSTRSQKVEPPGTIHLQRPCSHLFSPVRSEINPFSIAHSALARSRLDSVSLLPIMSALPRSAAIYRCVDSSACR